MEFGVLSQLAYYLPSLLAHLVAFAVGVAILARARTAGVLLLAGTGLQLLASCASFGSYAWTTSAYMEGALSAADISLRAGAIGLVASVTRAIGEVAVVAAVAAAVFLPRGAEAPAQDPYGFKPEK